MNQPAPWAAQPEQPQPVPQPEHIVADEPANEGPAVPEPAQPAPVAAQQPVHPGVSNAGPMLPPGAQAAAARAHVLYGHIIKMAQAAQADIERFVPPEMVQMAETMGLELLRGIL